MKATTFLKKYDNGQVCLTSCWENELNADIQLLGVDWGEKSSFQNLKKTLSNQNPEGNAQGLRIDLSGYCSKQLGAKKSSKVGHAALPSHLKPKLDQTAFW